MSFVKLTSFSSRLEAGIAGGILESHGIEHTIRGDDIGIFGPGHMGTSAVGIDLLVHEEDAPAARELLRDAGLLAG